MKREAGCGRQEVGGSYANRMQSRVGVVEQRGNPSVQLAPAGFDGTVMALRSGFVGNVC